MSFVITYPDKLAAAADQLQTIGATFAAGNAAASAPTTSVVPASADEVSLYTAAQFAVHAQRYQELSAQATRIHQLLVATLASGADAYATTEAANAAAAG
jgi:hypothetical protein